ncbi:uncharacterized protein [Macrobrachium rosenbergii]|uniref:uncharacterized protein n=1 Tax=Macrobrachium rosenbergii TaxID=79674 RepID=UPI0034D68C94
MAHCTAENWKYQLPWVLLGLRTAPRANGDLFATEKVYGESLMVPGELITGDHHNLTVQRLRDMVGKFTPGEWTYTDRATPFTPPGLSSTTHVFFRNDAVCLPLTRPYRGPFLVLERNKKAFRLAIHRKNIWVSIDRLKPALFEEDVGDTPQRPPQETSPPQPTLPTRKSRGCPHKAPDPGNAAANCSRTHRTPQLTSQSCGTLQRPSRYLL